jgi:hypothetical protein
MDMRMMLEALAPRMEHHEPPDRRAQSRGIRGDLEQRVRRRAEEQVVHDAFVRERQARTA